MVGLEAPGFAGKDLLGGGPAGLDRSLRGKVVLLEFGSIYSSAGMARLPTLMRLRAAYPREQLAIFTVFLDVTNPQRVLKQFRSLDVQVGFPVVIDHDFRISKGYQVESLPTTVVVDRDGVVVMAAAGHSGTSERELEKLLDDLIGGKHREETKTAIPADGPGDQLEVQVPESFTKTTGREVRVVGSVSGAGRTEVFYKLNDQPEKRTTAEDGVFHFATVLALGMNLVEVRVEAAPGEFVSESLVVFREAAYGREFRSELPRYLFHRDEDQKGCPGCHRLELSAGERSVTAPTGLCATCHGELLAVPGAHKPVAAGVCLRCHDEQSAPARFRPRMGGRSFCLGCHTSPACPHLAKAGQKPLMRLSAEDSEALCDPAGLIRCSSCHEGHASSYRKLARGTRQAGTCAVLCHDLKPATGGGAKPGR